MFQWWHVDGCKTNWNYYSSTQREICLGYYRNDYWILGEGLQSRGVMFRDRGNKLNGVGSRGRKNYGSFFN